MTKIRTLSRAAAAALLIAALAVPAAAAGTTDIGTEKAKDIALNHAKVAESDTLFLTVEPDYDDGRLEYEVEFYDGTTEYDYTIDGKTGTVLKFDTDLEWYAPDDDAGYGWKNVIGKQKAKEIALKQAGVSESDARRMMVKPDWDDGVRIYEVEFTANGREYDYEIDAETGTVLSQDSDAEHTAASAASATAGTGDIGSARAKSIALNHAGVKESAADFLYAEADWDDGRKVYDVEFYANGKEYDYEILAADGTILSYDYDAEREWSGSTSAGTGDIGSAKAKSIALNHAGVKESAADFLYTEADWDDGRRIYDVEFYAGGKEYDYEILAADGTILSYDYDAEREWSGSVSGSGDVISESKAKSIVTDRAGVSGTFRELKLDRDDGRAVYEGEMYSNGIQYEFEIDAVTGAVLDWDVDRDND